MSPAPFFPYFPKKSADGPILPGTDNYVSNTLNQYTAVPSAPAPPAPGYDPDGNATAYPVPAAPTQNATLAWDGENRLITTTVAGTVTTAQYDALSRRIAQTTGATREVTLYDGWNCIAEYEGAANTLHATNLWGTDLSGSPQGAGGVGGLLAVQKHTGPAIGINYPLYDGNGNITEYLNAVGAVVARYKYDPFGRIYASSGTLKDAFPYRFSTKRLDAATGLYYYGYRYYDPITGRWLSRDPIGEQGSANLYAFLTNNSVAVVDVLGLQPADQRFGLPNKFWDWYHRKDKRKGDPDLKRPQAEEKCKEWDRKGRPSGDDKSKHKGRERGKPRGGHDDDDLPPPDMPPESEPISLPYVSPADQQKIVQRSAWAVAGAAFLSALWAYTS